MKKSTTNRRILHVFSIMGLLYICLIASLSWFELYGKSDIVANSYNRRLGAEENDILRGNILDRKGIVLASTVEKDGIRSRDYPFKSLYTHVIGYDSTTYGKTLLEAQYNDTLLGRDVLGFLAKIEKLILNEQKSGNNLKLTIDHDLQLKCRALLDEKNGAIIAMNPKTGEILSMVSTPDFNPNESKLEANWSKLSEASDSPFLPRAIMGLYPPGSIFKVVTATAAIKSGLEETRIDDDGSVIIDGKTFSNHDKTSYKDENLTLAMTISSNVYFSQLADLIGAKTLLSYAEKAGIGKTFDFELPLTKSRIGTSDMGKTELAATGIGQGKLMVTPLQMLMIAAGIANDGNIMKPYLVSSISNSQNLELSASSPSKLYTFTDEATANKITEMMLEVVKNGTGSKAAISGVDVAGKTGTAQTEKTTQDETFNHAWFIGFAPASDPEIAVVVLLEYQDKGGGQAAAPIARKVISEWLDHLPE